jgi:hypothetical protein
LALSFEGREKDLEPFEGGRVFADPDELDTAETGRWVRSIAHMPDVLEDGGPRSDTDTSADEDSDFVVKDVFSGSSVRSINAKFGHLLSILECDLVHTHRVDTVVELGLSATSS